MIDLADTDTETGTFMFAEAAEAAEAVGRQFREQEGAFRRLGAQLRALAPRLVVTCARGSSDHAATYAKYLIESRAYAFCASAAPSISSIYASPLPSAGVVALAISQSGRSPDILHATSNLKEAGALVVALVNAADSPLAELADVTIPLSAGPEKSVAATKSHIASLAAIAQLVGQWTEDDELLAALRRLPSRLEEAFALDWRRAAEKLQAAGNLFVLGRGVGFGIAQEAALKLKETCLIHGEAFSAAEVLHGPAALVRAGFPVFAFAQDDETLHGMKDVLARLAKRGAAVIAAGAGAPGGVCLPTISAHPVLQPILGIQSFYRMANFLSLLRGLDPDRPPNLSKVTETI
jgi:glucosamine--fructose-6-phosphate aminotransferase (isomerizing)